MAAQVAHQFPSTQWGGRAFNHSQSQETEQEYDRLRSLARQEHGKRSSCFDKAHKAHERGDGRAAHELSEEGKRHGAMVEQYNKQASEYIFRANNAPGRVADDTIDLHGQFAEEAEQIVEARIRYAREHGQTHLHIIVGKGNHSVGHIQKLKPRVEEVCRELGLQYTTEENAGRMYVNLQGQPVHGMPPMPGGPQGGGYGSPPGQQQQQHGGQHGGQQHGGGGYPGQQHGGGGQGQGQDQVEAVVKKFLPRILRKLEKDCCIVM